MFDFEFYLLCGNPFKYFVLYSYSKLIPLYISGILHCWSSFIQVCDILKAVTPPNNGTDPIKDGCLNFVLPNKKLPWATKFWPKSTMNEFQISKHNNLQNIHMQCYHTDVLVFHFVHLGLVRRAHLIIIIYDSDKMPFCTTFSLFTFQEYPVKCSKNT